MTARTNKMRHHDLQTTIIKFQNKIRVNKYFWCLTTTRTDWELLSLNEALTCSGGSVLRLTLAVSALEASGWWPCRGRRRWTRSCAGRLLAGGRSRRASLRGSSCDRWTPAGRAGWRWRRGCRRLSGTLRMRRSSSSGPRLLLLLLCASSPSPAYPSGCCCCSRAAGRRCEAWPRPAAALLPSSSLSSSPRTRPGRRAEAAAGQSWTPRRPCEWRRAQTSGAGRPRWFLPGRGRNRTDRIRTRCEIRMSVSRKVFGLFRIWCT